MLHRFRRTLRRVITFPRVFVITIPIIWGWLGSTRKVIEQLQWWRDETLSALPYLKPYLTAVWAFILSPYFTLFLTLAALAFLFWRAWPVSNPTRAEFFIEMLEQRIRIARSMLKQPIISFVEWKTWEEKTVLDISEFLPQPRYLRHVQLFRGAGNLTTLEWEQGEQATSAQINRQIRMLNELIDRTDRGELQKESQSQSARSTSS